MSERTHEIVRGSVDERNRRGEREFSARPEPEWGAGTPGARASRLIALSRAIGLGGFGQRYIDRKVEALHPDFVDTRLWDVPLRLHPWANRSDRDALMLGGRSEAKEYAHVAHIMADHRAAFVDVGAGSGLFSLRAALASVDGGRILVVEPDPELVHHFNFNLYLARQAGRVNESVSIEISTSAIGDPSRQHSISEDRLGALLAEHGIVQLDVSRIDLGGGEGRLLMPFFAENHNRLWPRVLIVAHKSNGEQSMDCIEDCLRRSYRVKAVTRRSTILHR